MAWYQMFEDDDASYLEALRGASEGDVVLDLRGENDLKIHRARAPCIGGAGNSPQPPVESWTAPAKVLAHDVDGLEAGFRLYAQSYEWEHGPMVPCPVCKPKVAHSKSPSSKKK